MKQPKPSYSTLDLCACAAEMVKQAGFVHHKTSMKTEACYYRWPDRGDLLRIATHAKGGDPAQGKIVSRITFNGGLYEPPGMMKIADQKVESTVASAIGRYFLASAAALEGK